MHFTLHDTQITVEGQALGLHSALNVRAVTCMALPPTLADALEAHIVSRVSKKTPRPGVAAKAVQQLEDLIAVNGDVERLTGVAKAMAKHADVIQSTFHRMMLVEETLKGADFTCPFKWSIYPLPAPLREGKPLVDEKGQPRSDVKLTAEEFAALFKPFHNYGIGIRACWTDEELFFDDGNWDPGLGPTTNALVHAQDLITRLMCNALNQSPLAKETS